MHGVLTRGVFRSAAYSNYLCGRVWHNFPSACIYYVVRIEIPKFASAATLVLLEDDDDDDGRTTY
jgi:hypothetical protein